MESACKQESEKGALCQNLSEIENVRRIHGLVQGHDFSSDDGLLLDQTDRWCIYWGMFHFVYEKIKLLAPSVLRFHPDTSMEILNLCLS